MNRKALHVIESSGIGGAQRAMLDLLIGLRSRGWETAAALPEGGPLIAKLNAAGIPWRHLPIDRLWDRRAGATIAELVRREGFDIVHVHTPKAGMLVRESAKRAGARVVMHVHGFGARGWLENVALSPLERVKKTGLFILERRADRFTDRFLLVNRHDLERKVFPEKKQRLVYNGIAIEEWPVLPTREGTTILYPARLSRQKDPATVLRAAAALLPEFPDLKLLMAGDGELRAEMTALAKNLGLAKHARLLGDRDDMPALYRETDVVVLTTTWEGHPFTILEAMASGRPIVATDCPGIRESVREFALLVARGDHADVARAIAGLLRDPGLRRAMTAGARKLIEENFSVERMIDDVAVVYREL